MHKRFTLILVILLPLQIIATRILSRYPLLVEEFYSEGLYELFSPLLRGALGILPFSLGDLMYGLFIFLLLKWLFKRIKTKFSNPRRWIPRSLAILSLLYFCFNIFWGLNYYRLPLHQSLNIDNEYTTEELISLTRNLIAKSNEIHLEITGKDSVKVTLPYSKSEILDLSVEGYDHLEEIFPELSYNYVSLKRSLFSLPLTYMGFNGYLNPLTNEAQVNTLIVPYKLPTTSSHEIGHQLGFAAENEANFIACMATMNHPDIYFRYSGFTFALNYCLSELYRRDPQLTDKLMKEINFGILLNYREVREFWIAHKNPLEPFFMYTYGNYLKANNQEGGLKSYSYVVALLVNHFQKNPGFLK